MRTATNPLPELTPTQALRTDILEKGQVAAAARPQQAWRDRARCDIAAMGAAPGRHGHPARQGQGLGPAA